MNEGWAWVVGLAVSIAVTLYLLIAHLSGSNPWF